MQGMAEPLGRGGAGGRHQRLRQDLAAKNPLGKVVGIEAAEDVLLDLFQVEQANQFGDGTSHDGL